MSVLQCLYRIKVFTPKGLWYLLYGIYLEGITLNALLFFCAKMYGEKDALIEGDKRLSFEEFYEKSSNLASNLVSEYKFKQCDAIALVIKNSVESIITLFALSRVGVHVYLINTDISNNQYLKLQEKYKFKFVIYEDKELEEKLSSPSFRAILIRENQKKSLSNLMLYKSADKLKKTKPGNIIILTGGTTGDFKCASRNQSIFNFFNPLEALVNELQLHTYKSVYISVPIYHGYGLAAAIVSVLLGSEIYVTNSFNTKEALTLIDKNKIEVIIVVPTILSRMLSENTLSLISLKKVVSGGAPLTSGLISDSRAVLGDIMYNLYGTSEAGFCVLATPKDLKKYPKTIGRPIKGVKTRFRLDRINNIEELAIKSKWSIKKEAWVKTGDLVFVNKEGLLFLKGRTDDMIVSGGENVYPNEIEDIMSLHPKIEIVSILPVNDDDFGKRLEAFVQLKPKKTLAESELKAWLKGKIARYEMPVSIEFVNNIPLSSIGKVNRKELRKRNACQI